MKILVIGGTGFIGPHVVRELCEMGHSVSVFHRGSTRVHGPATLIVGERRDLAAIRPKADVVVDLILSSGAQAESLMGVFRGVAERVVAASSIDVYRACGVLHGSEDGPLEPVPLTEDSPLRTKLQTYPPAQVKMLQEIFGWIDGAYDKIPVERAILSDPKLPGTVLRLPMIYGPGDRLSRFHPVLKRIDDGRRQILLEKGMAAWRSPRGYVENVAAALALAAVSERAAGRVYNVAEMPAFSEIDWARKIAAATGWDGEFITLPKERTPPHLVQPGNSAQHWETDSTRIRRELGYQETVPLDEAIQRTIDWARAHPPGEFNPHKFDYAAEDAAVARSGMLA
ncbi:MAG TPA: NAD-dependent epimerase/dehydratase family protein [Bryobacteraceae bacterium]|nr:NAD-dependent epimerase/dehydratase family protein [Bryobacteraceae bacterium]